jgi:hypothetical protein
LQTTQLNSSISTQYDFSSSNSRSGSKDFITVENHKVKLNCLFSNIRSLNRKISELQLLMHELNIDVACLCETWLTESISDSMIVSNSFSIFRKDRTNNRKGGGVCIITRNNSRVLFNRVNLPSRFHNLELVVIDILLGNNNGVRLAVVYYPPDQLSNLSTCQLLVSAFMFISNTNLSICIAGDFNLPLMDWTNNCSPNNNVYIEFLSYFTSNSLVQLVNFPTREDNILDVILSDNPQQICNIRSCAPIGSSDHLSVLYELVLNSDTVTNVFIDPTSTQDSYRFNFSNFKYDRADWASIRTSLSVIDWFYVFDECVSTDQCWTNICSILQDVFNTFIPKKNIPKPGHRNCGSKIQYKRKVYSKRIRRALNKKLAAWRSFKNGRSNVNRAKFNKCATNLKKTIFYEDIKKENKLIESGSSRSFFSHIKRKTSKRDEIPPLMNPGIDSFVYSDAEKASLLNSYFSSVFTEDDHNLPHFEITKVLTDKLSVSNIYFSEFTVAHKIKKLKNSCSPGYDSFTVTPLKKLNFVIAKPLSMLFNISMNTGEIPKAWKNSIVVPIFKKGDKSDKKNYRPISLTSIICKLMESIIKDDLLTYLRKNELIYSKQYGFMPRRSTNTQLLRYFNDLSSCLINGCQVDSIYLDYSKAFDSISHNKLIFKLGRYGVSGNLLQWLTSFLTGRLQSVKVGSCYSEWSIVRSGVPQGSVLGPILFLIYVNDLISSCPELNSLFLFADDAKCFATINSLSDCETLQKSLDSISGWSNLWQLSLAADKCQVISFSNKKVASFDFIYNINSVPLLKVKDVMDLGVRFTNDFSFSSHIKEICNKARRKASIILNCFKSKNQETLFRAFTVFVRPTLDYCSNLWSPYRKTEIDLLESVQKRFTKRLDGMLGLQYSERLKSLGSESLEQRRIKSDLCMYYKVIAELVDLPIDEFFVFKKGVTRNNGSSIYMNLFHVNAERYYFKNRCITAWNSLPPSVVNASSLNAFKRCLEGIDFSKYLRS